MILLILSTLYSCAAAAAPEIESNPPQTVESILRAEPTLWKNHCGFLAYLVSHPELSAAEAAFAARCSMLSLAQLDAEFDDALAKAPEQERLFDRHFDALAHDAGLRAQVTALYRLALEEKTSQDLILGALHFYRANPDQAISLMRSQTRNIEAPIEMRRVLPYLKEKPAVHDALLDCFETLRNATGAGNFFAWWQSAEAGKTDAARTYIRLETYLIEHPSDFWAWQYRQTVLAEDPHVRDWIRYLYRTARHILGSPNAYPSYLARIQNEPQTVDRITKDAPAASNWPPLEQPPATPAAPKNTIRPQRPSKNSLMPARPEKPSITRPTKPVPPSDGFGTSKHTVRRSP